MRRSRIVAARRSAVTPRGGAFRALELHQLAAPVIQAALADAGIAVAEVGELILGNALGAGGNPARVAALASGLPERVAGLTLDRQCCGGLDAILLGDAMIRSGMHEVVIAGGVESYSRRPLRLRSFADGREPQPYDQPPFTPWPERDPEMSAAAGALADRLGITREVQESWAMRSHGNALAAMPVMQQGEIVPLAGVTSDSFARNLTPPICARAKVLAGTVTTATTAVAADGVAVCVLVSDRLAERMGQDGPEIVGGATIGGDPELPGLAPIAAIRSVLADQRLDPSAIDRAEIMEAFAAQAIACQQGAGLDPAIVNRGGGALARGHPIGASGAINAVRLIRDMRPGEYGLAAIAAAGGLGTALLLRS
ncbi:thiolase family protein [Paracoccus methylarcula]|uniref:Thiolase family protein n=1 Tax=Paracoccus methylarcula TaxID=72022 RepID=A0A422QTE1_9RHOB|nr:thiolase family protein [Paracoccus methylarcula]RNF33041.1 thiolase family protein [Paracoccus methylarcula]